MSQTFRQITGCCCAALSLQLAAATTNLADIPLANAPTVSILPNIAFILDDSGSMDWENMPNADNDSNNDKNCWRWFGYNTLFYNPAVTYKAPLKADGSRYANQSFSAAWNNGYSTSPTPSTINLAALTSAGISQSDANLPRFDRDHRVTSVKVTLLDGTPVELLKTTPAPSAGTDQRDDIGIAVAASINANTSTTGFKASYDENDNILTITAPNSQAGLTTTPVITTEKTEKKGDLQYITASPFETVGGKTYNYYSTHKTNPLSTGCDINSNYSVTGTSSAIAAPNTTPGSAEALTNYANWYSYYRKRIYLAKASAAEAFGALEHTETVGGVTTNKAKYRIGLYYLNNTSRNLEIADFTGSARSTWFDRLFATTVDGSTPLRTALSRAGRMYGGKTTTDPVQYSCQRNFAILTTDGFWNSGGTADLNNDPVGAQDSGSSVPRPFYDKIGQDNTLADVAYYYYTTDLRPGTCSVCEDNVPPAGTKAVDDTASHQHMTTFAIGLGVKGILTYKEGYKYSTSGDYYDITQGTQDWPKIKDYGGDSDLAKIDDLWHAAVNGRGTYYSAQNAESFTKGLIEALGSIEAATGSGAAAATSNLQPTSGDNYIYIANYRTAIWDGELSSYEIDLATGEVAKTNCTGKTTKACWQASELLANKVQKTDSGSVLTGDADSRTIYTYTSDTTTYPSRLKPLTWSALSLAEKAYFDNTLLSQYSGWSAEDQTAATGEKLLKYLRGQDRNEDQSRTWTSGTYNRLYRDREKILGDIVHSQPVYVKSSFYEYLDTGYSSFRAGTTTRAGTVYVASNDGMLHAFDASTGEERWAYVPPQQLSEMWRLADNNYATHHRYYLDGPLTVSDIYDGTAWKTILVGAMGKGGRAVYALDVTDPASPKALWNFTNDNLGYTYGTPIITKIGTTWTVLVASGYNNVSPGDGKGYVFVLNANTGALIKTLKTNVGDTDTPSGLAHLNIKVNEFQKDNTALRIYGGDLLGNLWRFDPNADDLSTGSKVLALGSSKPISVAPELGEVNAKTALFFGTGRYLGTDDLSTTGTQSFYAVRDDGSTTVDVANMNKITATKSGSGSSEQITLSGSSTDWSTTPGWYFDLPTEGERVNLPAQLYFGTILFPTTVPTASECQPGGYSWLYALDYASGLRVQGSSVNAWKYVSPLVGVTVAKLPTGDVAIYGITADGGLPKGTPPGLPIATGVAGSDSGMRIMWRELLN